MFIPEVESLGVQSLWLLNKALPSREEPRSLNTRSNDFIRTYILNVRGKIASLVAERGEGA